MARPIWVLRALALVVGALTAGSVGVDVAVAACPTASSSAYKSAVTGTAGVVAFWRAGETSGTDACDSAASNHGSYQGSFTLGQFGALSGDTNKAVGLSGSNGGIAVVPSSLTLNPSTISVEAWLKPTSVAASAQTVVRKDQQYLLRMDGDDLYWRVWLSGGAYGYVVAPDVVQAGVWQHIVASFDGQKQRLFRNGRLLLERALVGSMPGSANQLNIGRSQDYYDQFNGVLDEAAIYSRALSTSEVRGHYEIGSGTDLTAPQTTITSSPSDGNTGDATFSFVSSEGGSTFECRLDDGSWSGCASPKAYTGLGDGEHSFEVRATDAAGNVDSSPARAEWVVEALAFTRPALLHANGAELKWTAWRGAASASFAGYEVHRATGSAAFTPSASTRLVAIADRAVTSFRDTTAAAGGTFTYKLLIGSAVLGTHTVTLPTQGKAELTLQPAGGEGTATYLRQGACDNFGASSNVRAGVSSGGTDVLRALVSFDLRSLPADAQVTSAIMSLYAYAQPTVPVTFAAHRVTADWSEGHGTAGYCSASGASWGHTVGGTPWAQAGGDFVATAAAEVAHAGTEAAGWDAFAVTSLVQEWVKGTHANFGVAIKAVNESLSSAKGIQYWSDDATDAALRPKLRVLLNDGSQSLAPEVSLARPGGGSRISGQTQLVAAASDDRRVDTVEFLVDGALVGTDTAAPWSVTWNSASVSRGNHTITVRATDDAGAQSTSAGVVVDVRNSLSPTVRLTTPARPYKEAILANAPAAYWRLGEATGTVAADASGNNRPATYGGTYTLARPGWLLDEADTSVLLKNASADGSATAVGLTGLLGQKVSAEAWIDYGSISTAGTSNHVISRNWGSNGGWRLDVSQASTGGTQKASWAIRVANNNTVTVSANVTPGRLHLVGTYDGTTLRLYVNGTQAATAALSAAVLNTTAAVAVGQTLNNDMTVDEAAVFPSALSADDVDRHYEAGLGLRGTTSMTATATDDYAVDNVQFTVDGTVVKETSASPYESGAVDLIANGIYDGTHTITAKATDNDGQVSESAPVAVKVTNTTGTKYQAVISSTQPPLSMTWDPAASATQEKAGFDVTVQNKSAVAWPAGTVELRYQWIAPGGSIAGSGTVAGVALTAGATTVAPITAQVPPPALADGVNRADHTLRFDVADVGGATFASKGNQPLEHRVGIRRKTSVELGLERYYHYDSESLGAGMTHLANVASGNSIVRWTPLQSAGRGLSTVVDLTYNSLEDHSKSPAGNNVSLAISSLVRLGSRLDVHPNKADDIAGNPKRRVELIDGDGTTHVFTGDTSTGTLRWNPPAGVHLYLREFSSTDTARKWAITRPDRVTYFFDVDGFPTSVEDANANRLTFTLQATPSGEDPGGPAKRVVKVTDAAGNDGSNIPARSFDVSYYSKSDARKPQVRGKVKAITDHTGSALRFEYYEDGNLLRLTQSGGTKADGSALPDRAFVFSYTENTTGQPAIATLAGRLNPDPKSTPPQSTRLYSVIDPRGHETVFGYLPTSAGTERHKLSARTDRAGKQTTYSYDTTLRQTTVTAPLSRVTRYTADTSGQVTQIKDPGNFIWDVEWRADRHVGKVTEPLRQGEPARYYTTFDYDSNGYLTEQRDQAGRITRLTYDRKPVDAADTIAPHISELKTKTDPAGTVAGGTGHVWSFTYDAKGNLKTVTDPEQAVTSYDYAANGNLVQAVDPNHNVTTYESHDAAGQPQKVTQAGDAQDPSRVTHLGYDGDGLLRWVQDAAHPAASYSLTAADDVARKYRTYYGYDSFHRLGRVSTPRSTTQANGLLIVTDTEYDANDNVVLHVGAHDGEHSDRGARTTTTYDVMDRPVDVAGPTRPDAASEAGYLADRRAVKYRRYQYDDAGRLQIAWSPRATKPNLRYATRYDYDNLDRLIATSRQHTNGAVTKDLVERRCYDAVGNLTQVTRPKSTNFTACGSSTRPSHSTTLAWFPDGQLKSSTNALLHTRSYEYDSNGQLWKSTDEENRTTEHYYDRRGLLTKVIEPFNGTERLTARMQYDPAGNLTIEASPRAVDTNPGLSDYTGKPYVTTTTYNPFGEPVRTEQPSDAKQPPLYIHRAFDALGRLSATSLPVTASQRPALGANWEQPAAGEKTTWTRIERLDPGWIFRSRDPNGQDVSYDYSSEGWQIARSPIRGGAAQTKLESRQRYYADGLLAQRTNRRGQIDTYEYDLNDNLTFGYDDTGVTSAFSGRVDMSASYDDLDRLSLVSDHKSQPGDGKPDYTQETTFTYDDNGNVATQYEGKRVYDDSTPATSPRHLVYSHDQADRFDILNDYGRGSGTGDDRLVDVDLSPAGRELQRTVTRDQSGASKQVTSRTFYDNGLLKTAETRSVTSAANTLIESHDLRYRDDNSVYLNGNPTRDEFKLRGPAGDSKPCSVTACTTNWAYDALERVTRETRARNTTRSSCFKLRPEGGVDTQWAVDGATCGEPTDSAAVFRYDGTQLTEQTVNGDTVARYFYRDGNLRCVTTEAGNAGGCGDFDASADALPGWLVEFNEYDAQDRITLHRDRVSGERMRRTNYVYDALDRLANEKICLSLDAAPGTCRDQSHTTTYAYVGLSGMVDEETQVKTGTGTPTPGQRLAKDRVKSYLYDADGQRVSLTDTINGQTAKTYTYGYDPHGSVSTLTDTDGTSKAAYSYLPYGDDDRKDTQGAGSALTDEPDEITPADPDENLDPLNAYRYSAKRFDPGSTALDMGARQFGGSAPAFLQQDSYEGALDNLGLSTDPLTANRYSLAGGNPISFMEYDGHEPISSFHDQRSVNVMTQKSRRGKPDRAASSSGGTFRTGRSDAQSGLGYRKDLQNPARARTVKPASGRESAQSCTPQHTPGEQRARGCILHENAGYEQTQKAVVTAFMLVATEGAAALAVARGASLAASAGSKGAAKPGRSLPRIAGGAPRPDEILQPGGSLIGRAGSRPGIREVQGGRTKAERLFDELTLGGTDITPAGHPGRLVRVPEGQGVVGLRLTSKSGPPTIDVNIRGLPIDKLKFVP